MFSSVLAQFQNPSNSNFISFLRQVLPTLVVLNIYIKYREIVKEIDRVGMKLLLSNSTLEMR